MGFLSIASALLAQALVSSAAGAPWAPWPLGTPFGVPCLNATYDYIVVGGGNAGLVVASRLSEVASNRVAVVEAGGFYELNNGNISQLPIDDVYWTGKDKTDFNPLIDWGFITTPQAGVNGIQTHYARGKTLGGCSARNYMNYHRATIGAYQKWADEVGDQSYTFENFNPYFQMSLDFKPPNPSIRQANATPAYNLSTLGNGQGSPLALTFPNYGMPFSTWTKLGMQQIGIQPIQGMTSGSLLGSAWVVNTINHTTGFRETSETAYLPAALGRPNFSLYIESLAKQVLFSGNKATGVQVSTGSCSYTLAANKEVILSAGTFQSPQLLMVSGIGPAATLKQFGIKVISNLAGVGQNMWDHVYFGINYRVNVDTSSALQKPAYAAEAAQQFMTNQGSILGNPGGDMIAFEKVPSSMVSEQIQQELNATFPADWPELEYFSVGGYTGNQDNYITGAPTDGYNYASLSPALVAPLSRGNITISSADMADPPVINPNWLTHPSDQAVVIAGFKRARAVYNTTAMRNITIGPEYYPGPQVQTDAQILQAIKESFNAVFHASATCAMGNSSNPMAVVDSHARVFGVTGLRVVDASAMPFLPPGQPMGTIYALAEKIAADIKNGQ